MSQFEPSWKPKRHLYRKRERDQTKAEPIIQVDDTPLADLDLGARIVNMMERAGYLLLRDIKEVTAEILAGLDNFGEDSLVQLRRAVVKKGVAWGVTVGQYRRVKKKMTAALLLAKAGGVAPAPPAPPLKPKRSQRRSGAQPRIGSYHRWRQPYKGLGQTSVSSRQKKQTGDPAPNKKKEKRKP